MSSYQLAMSSPMVRASTLFPSSHTDLFYTEPGYYEDSKFGIRIENVIMARETKDLPHSFGDKPWLSFEHVTMVPMCRKLVDDALLTDDERSWLNTYHKEVWEKTEGYLAGKGDGSDDGADGIGRRWLWRETRPI